MQKVGDVFTGNLRETPEMTGQGMPDQGKAMLNDASILGGTGNQIKFEAATATMFDPNEIAQVAVTINPELQIRHNKDAQGNVYPILTNPQTGANSQINMPGIDARDITKGLTTAALFGRTGGKGQGVGRVAGALGKSTAMQTGVEAQHALSGGEFNPSEVAMAGVGGMAGELIPMAAGAILRKIKGAPVDEVAKPAKFRGQKRKWEMTPAQRAKVDNLKEGYDSSNANLSLTEKTEQMKQALASGDESRVAAMVEVDDDYLKALDNLGLEERGLTSAATSDIQLQQIEQGLKKIPGSESAAREAKQITELSQKADDLILEFGGSLDKSEVSNKLLNKVKVNIDKQSAKAEDIYTRIADNIGATEHSDMINIGSYMRNELDELGGDLSQLSGLEKRILKMSENGATYKSLDKLRKQVGAKIGGTSTKFADEDTATLKNIYSLLTQDQESVAVKRGMGDAWSQAKELVKKRKVLEDDTINLFGKNLNENVMSKLGPATAKLAKGDYKKFFELVGSVPKKDRQEVIISALNDAFTTGSRKEKQLSVPGFADWYNGLSRNPQLKTALYKYLPPQLSRQIDSMGKVSNNVRNSMSQAPVGGQVMAAPGVLDKVMDGIGEKFLSKLPGMLGGAVKAGLDKSKNEGSEKAMKMLSSPEFSASIKALAQGQAKKAAALEKKFIKTQAYKGFLKTLSKQGQILIAKQGFMNWLKSDEQEVEK